MANAEVSTLSEKSLLGLCCQSDRLERMTLMGVKSLAALQSPQEGVILSGEVCERFDNSGIIGYKWSLVS